MRGVDLSEQAGWDAASEVKNSADLVPCESVLRPFVGICVGSGDKSVLIAQKVDVYRFPWM